jgi:hypothetical protein
LYKSLTKSVTKLWRPVKASFFRSLWRNAVLGLSWNFLMVFTKLRFFSYFLRASYKSFLENIYSFWKSDQVISKNKNRFCGRFRILIFLPSAVCQKKILKCNIDTRFYSFLSTYRRFFLLVLFPNRYYWFFDMEKNSVR